MGPKSADCMLSKKKKNSNETNMIDGLSQYVNDMSISAVILNVNMVDSNL